MYDDDFPAVSLVILFWTSLSLGAVAFWGIVASFFISHRDLLPGSVITLFVALVGVGVAMGRHYYKSKRFRDRRVS